MSSTSTTWSTQGNTKAGATSTSADSLTTGTLTADTLQLSSNIIKASDGGSTITLDTSDNVTIGGGLTIVGDLTITGGNITNAITCDSDLTVGGNIYADSFVYHTGDTNSYLKFTNDRFITYAGGHTVFDYSEDSSSTFNVDTEGLADITFGGGNVFFGGAEGSYDAKVGIGTSTPASTLSVAGTLTVGVDDTGYDVKFFGATSGNYWLYDESANRMHQVGTGQSTVRIETILASADIGPALQLYRNSASPAASDVLGSVTYKGTNATDGSDSEVTYARMRCWILDATKDAEEGKYDMSVMANGTQSVGMYLSGQADGTVDAAIGLGAGSVTTITGDLTISGGDVVAGANSSTQGTLSLWDGGGGNTPGYLVLYSPNGTANYIFCEDDGTLKRHTSAPTANSDGSEIGGQS